MELSKDDPKVSENKKAPSTDEKTLNLINIIQKYKLGEIGGFSLAIQDPVLSEHINKYCTKFYIINVYEMLKDLSTVGNLIKLAYSGTQSHPSGTYIWNLLFEYQKFIQESSTSIDILMWRSFQALSSLQLAIKEFFINDEKSKSAGLKFIAKCSLSAGEMAKTTKNLINSCDKLIALAENAFNSAIDDELELVHKKHELDEFINDLKAKQEKLNTSISSLEQLIQEQENQIHEFEKRADREESRTFWLKFLTIAFFPITILAGNFDLENIPDSAEEWTKLAEKTRNMRNKLMGQMKDQNNDLNETVSQLKKSNEEDNELERTMNALKISIQNLGKIKTAFGNINLFWSNVEKHCDSLTKTDVIQALMKFDSLLIPEVLSLLFNWAALAKINYISNQYMDDISKTVDDFVRDIPGSLESKNLVDELSKKIIERIQEENKYLELDIKTFM